MRGQHNEKVPSSQRREGHNGQLTWEQHFHYHCDDFAEYGHFR
jgi:hypothetical protein